MPNTTPHATRQLDATCPACAGAVRDDAGDDTLHADAERRTKADWRYQYLKVSDATRAEAEALATDGRTAAVRVAAVLAMSEARGAAGSYLGNESLLAMRRVLEEHRLLWIDRAALASAAPAPAPLGEEMRGVIPVNLRHMERPTIRDLLRDAILTRTGRFTPGGGMVVQLHAEELEAIRDFVARAAGAPARGAEDARDAARWREIAKHLLAHRGPGVSTHVEAWLQAPFADSATEAVDRLLARPTATPDGPDA